MIGRRIPAVVLKTRVRDERVTTENPYRWQDLSTEEFFAGRRIAAFSLPGAFTPVCTSDQCPAYERQYDELRSVGVDEVCCIAVNDAFVLFHWARFMNIRRIQLLPDGSGHFTRRMGMLVNKEHLGFGYRSWRYSMVVHDGVIEQFFEEPGINDAGEDDDPYTVTSPDAMIAYLSATEPASQETWMQQELS